MGTSKNSHDATRQERKAKKRKLEDAVPDLPGDVADTGDSEEVGRKAGKKQKRDTDTGDGVIDEEKQRKREKKERKKLRKEEAEFPEEGGVPLDVVDEDGEGVKNEKSKKDKRAKKSAVAEEPVIELETVAEEAGPKKSKKERKAERRAKEAAEGAAPVEELKESKSEQKVNGNASMNGEAAEGEKKSRKNNRNREKKRKGTVPPEGGAVNGNAEKPTGEGKEKKDARFICFIGTSPFLFALPILPRQSS